MRRPRKTGFKKRLIAVLAICRHLAEQMGGVMGVRSAPGEGSTFWFEIPCVPGAAPEHGEPGKSSETASDAGGTFDGIQVLVAEDNRVNQMLAIRLLEKLGCEVDLASNGVEAVEKVRSQRFGMVFMDCQMPEMDGYEATREIRRMREPAASTPIVALTANALPEDRQRAVEAGMDGHLTKPVKKEDMRRVLKQFAGSYAVGRERV